VTSRLEGPEFAAAAHEVGGVVELGHVDDAFLAQLYRECAVLAFPSRYEGFGLPVLEAMSYGAPVVASNASAIPETGGDAACYVAAGDATALATAIARVMQDGGYAAELRQRGLVHAAAFTWERTAERTLATIEGTL
jgi:glycosyltransferase involved in cell wall biosynthesis